LTGEFSCTLRYQPTFPAPPTSFSASPIQEEEVNLQRRARKIKSGKGGFPLANGEKLLLFSVGQKGYGKVWERGLRGREPGKTKTKTSTQNDIPRQSKGGWLGGKTGSEKRENALQIPLL